MAREGIDYEDGDQEGDEESIVRPQQRSNKTDKVESESKKTDKVISRFVLLLSLGLLGCMVLTSEKVKPATNRISESARKGVSAFKEGLPTDPGWKNMPVTDAMAGWSPPDTERNKKLENPNIDLLENVKPSQETVAAMGEGITVYDPVSCNRVVNTCRDLGQIKGPARCYVQRFQDGSQQLTVVDALGIRRRVNFPCTD